MKKEWVALVQRQVEAYNRKDLDGFLACYHKNVSAEWLDGSRAARIGIESFRENYRELFATSPNLRGEIASRVVLEDTVVDEERIQGWRGKTDLLHAVVIYAFRDDLIHRVWFTR